MTRTNMKKFIGSIKRGTNNARSKSSDQSSNGALEQQSLPQGDGPEATVVREVFAFCEAGAPGSPVAGDEYLHLPAIVDASESSPSAAREAATTIQRYLSKQNFDRGYAQYNAIMLFRILTDNPGRLFTQNFDKSFVTTVKVLLRECKDSSVQQIMRETLDYFEAEKLNGNDTLMLLIEMWRKEKGGSARMYSSSVGMDGTAVLAHDYAHNDQGRSHSHAQPNAQYGRREPRPPRGLPSPDELAARVEEARTSARLLVQMVQSTPQNELIGNELIKEFADRAKQAQSSIQQYMACENPQPDEHTMLTLIETSEQLSISTTKHQRAMLQARRAAGQASQGPSPQPQATQQDPFSTMAMQNALPPQQPARTEQTRYMQPPQQQYNRYESEDLYNNAASTVSPIEPNEHSYVPPIGPPPGAIKQSTSSYPQSQPQSDTYQPYGAQPVSPVRASNPERTHPAAKDYDVADNPFTDDNAYAAPSHPPPSQQPRDPHTMFNRAAGQLRDPASPTYGNASPVTNSNHPDTAELDSGSYPVPPPQNNRNSQTRPEPHGYNSGWAPTPSFVGRQQSSEAHITMSGASPERR